jgi:hypothetical protein
LYSALACVIFLHMCFLERIIMKYKRS